MQRIVNNIYDYKVELMGFAILILMIFHSSIPTFYGLKNVLDFGVDIFLFLGGFTCTLSYCKLKLNEGILMYYKKRVWRILPPYLLLYVFIYANEYLFNGQWDWAKYWGELSMWNNLVHNSVSMWYVPAVLIMYCIIPVYVDSFDKYKTVRWTPLLALLFVAGMHLSGWSRYLPFGMVWDRLPIYFLGVNAFLLKKNETHLNKWFVLCGVVVAFWVCLWLDGLHQLGLKRLCYIPMVIATVYFYDQNKWCKKLFGWAGVCSFENYMLHWYVVKLLYIYTAGIVVSALVALPGLNFLKGHQLGLEALYASVVGIPMALFFAYMYHRLLDKTVYKYKL